MSDAERIAALEVALDELWWLFSNAYMQGQQPNEIARSQAFNKMDKRLRELGVLPKVSA